MKIRVLGLIEVSDDTGNRIALASAAQRRLLSMLVIHRGSVVRAEWLAESSGVSLGALRVTVSRLRKLVGDALVVTAADGYVLPADDTDVDACRFEVLLGQTHLAEDDQKVALLDEALGEWRGPAYAEFAEEEWARPAVVRLDELRAAAVEDRFAALLAVGRFTDAGAGLATHIAEFPLRDRARGLLMRALAAQGRQAEALRVYQAYHRYLGSEIGTEPSHELRDLERRIAAGWHDATTIETERNRSPRPAGNTRRSNLATPPTRFIGRTGEVEALIELARGHRLVTLTGVGGVGKTRLAVQVATELMPEFPDGVWMVELAPVEDPGAVPIVVASTLGLAPQPGLSATESIAHALRGQRVLVVLDNCEHVLDAAAELVEAVISSPSVTVIATSREGLRVAGEQLWPVPSLDVTAGFTSAAVELFLERAREVRPGFGVLDTAESGAVIEICRRLDGIALAIELAAARMVSMSVEDVRDRLDDRFRLLSGSRRGIERHQTLLQAVQWSFDLLAGDERIVMNHCSVFAGSFDLAAATRLCGDRFDEFAVLDLLDALVRKSLVVTVPASGHVRYRLLETIRQFAQEQLAASGASGNVRDAHAAYFADEAITNWAIWEGPGFRVARDWVEIEFANLRVAFRWAADRAKIDVAAAIAAHSTMLAIDLQPLESVGWAEEILPAAVAADVRQLPRLFAAASFCFLTGTRAEVGVGYAETAVMLEVDPRYESFEPGWAKFMEASSHLYAGRNDRYLQICADLVAQTGSARLRGLCGMTNQLARNGREAEAMALAEETLAAARSHASPFWIAFALNAYGQAFVNADPRRALLVLREGLAYARQHRLPFWEVIIGPDLARLEAVHGDPDQALVLFEDAVESFHQVGNSSHLFLCLAGMAVVYAHLDRPEIAATLYGHIREQPAVLAAAASDMATVANLVRSIVGDTVFEKCVSAGAAMDLTDAVRYARHQIQLSRIELAGDRPDSP